MATDPVCGMDVVEATAQTQNRIQAKGQTYYFCAPGCKKAFEGEPETYLDPNYKPSM
jgi:YHS domain-containing protein